MGQEAAQEERALFGGFGPITMGLSVPEAQPAQAQEGGDVSDLEEETLREVHPGGVPEDDEDEFAEEIEEAEAVVLSPDPIPVGEYRLRRGSFGRALSPGEGDRSWQLGFEVRIVEGGVVTHHRDLRLPIPEWEYEEGWCVVEHRELAYLVPLDRLESGAQP